MPVVKDPIVATRRGYAWLLRNQGLSCKEISKIVGVAPGTVSMELSSMNRRLYWYVRKNDASKPCERCGHDRKEHYDVSNLHYFMRENPPWLMIPLEKGWRYYESPRWHFSHGILCECGCTSFWSKVGNFMETELPP
jgi:hypothetical protein